MKTEQTPNQKNAYNPVTVVSEISTNIDILSSQNQSQRPCKEYQPMSIPEQIRSSCTGEYRQNRNQFIVHWYITLYVCWTKS